MTTDARYTGPRTEAGKAASARNSTKHGLFTQRDFILEGEDEEYAQTFTDLMTELAPGGILEQTFATEIMGATWRLRRCRILEFDLARATGPTPDAEADARTAKRQQSIDRARAQSHNILRRSLAELRKLQTERHTRILQMPGGQVPTDLGLTDSRKAVNTAAHSTDAKRAAIGAAIEEQWRRNEEQFEALLEDSSFCKPANPPNSSFCNPAATPRNALCPCGSGVKYKRCCGKNAPPVFNIAA